MDDMAASVRSLVESMQPSHLHDLAIEMGATCPVREAPEEPAQPEPMVTITSSSAATVRTLSEEAFADLQREMDTRAADVARSITKH